MAEVTRNKFRPVRLAALVALLTGSIVVGFGSMRTATGPAEGDALAGGEVRATTRPVVRVATFNIHSGVGRDGRKDLDRIAEQLRGFDVVGLNEVRGPLGNAGGDQAALLGRALGMPHVFAPTERQWWHDSFGNGLLCALPIDGWKRVPLAGSGGRGRRNVVHARVRVAGRALHVFVTHIDRQDDRAAQIKAVGGMFLSADGPAVLMGDLNSGEDDAAVKWLLDAEGVDEGPRTKGIDWILTRGCRWIAGGSVDVGASDHPMAWGELELMP
jgi:hypothetical protein